MSSLNAQKMTLNSNIYAHVRDVVIEKPGAEMHQNIAAVDLATRATTRPDPHGR
jgi:hypothetical protein